MKKVGLVSVRNYNYGSILQAYALQQELFDAGIDNELIYYKKRNVIKQAVRIFNITLLLSKIRDIKRMIVCKTNPKLKPIYRGRNAAFTKFLKENFIFSPQLAGRKKLIEYTKKFDAFVLGSDQVWNPMLLGGDYYTLTWVPDSKAKVSYASSFGVTEIPSMQKRKTTYYLSRFNMISVRESKGADIVSKLTGKDATVCCDPTVLTDRQRWDVLSGDVPIIKEQYVFCYFIGKNLEHREFAKKLANLNKCKILAIKHIDEYIEIDDDFGDIEYLDVGPKEFVNFVRYSSFVCTDSFHGTIFSLLYQKTFFTFKRFSDAKSNSMNSRVINILQIVGLEDRLLENDTLPKDAIKSTIEWTQVQCALDEYRQSSRNYFNAMIEYIRS